MSGVNKVIILGNVGRDPETSYTQSGTAICSLSIATSEKWKDKNTGEQKEQTEWHRVKFFGKSAETIGQYISKGSQLYVEGKLKTSSYEKDGTTRYSTDIIGDRFNFVGGSNQQGQPTGNVNRGGFQQPQQQSGFKQQPQQQPSQQQQYFESQGGQQIPNEAIPF